MTDGEKHHDFTPPVAILDIQGVCCVGIYHDDHSRFFALIPFTAQ